VIIDGGGEFGPASRVAVLQDPAHGPVLLGHLVENDPDTFACLTRTSTGLDERVSEALGERGLLFARASKEHLDSDDRHCLIPSSLNFGPGDTSVPGSADAVSANIVPADRRAGRCAERG